MAGAWEGRSRAEKRSRVHDSAGKNARGTLPGQTVLDERPSHPRAEKRRGALASLLGKGPARAEKRVCQTRWAPR